MGTVAAGALAQSQFTTDYPPEALRLHHQGTVQYEVTIGTDGRAHDCKITASSGYAELDEATCQLVVARARFQPARDKDGNLVEDHWANKITWKLPN